MITFDEFLIQYNDVVEEASVGLGLTDNAQEAIISTMKKYLGQRRFDPVDLISLFQSVCYSTMYRGQLSRTVVEDKVRREMDNYLYNKDLKGDYSDDSFPDKGIKGL